MKQVINNNFNNLGRLLEVSKELLSSRIELSALAIVHCLKNKNKVLICGNGGSAADSQHFASELVGRFYLDRSGLSAIALTTDSSLITSLANDYSYSQIFSRQVEALARSGDILIGLSTSGNSDNVVEAVKKAKELDCSTIAFTGETGGKLKDLADIVINIPSQDTPRIQEVHLLIYHTICQLVEKSFFG